MTQCFRKTHYSLTSSLTKEHVAASSDYQQTLILILLCHCFTLSLCSAATASKRHAPSRARSKSQYQPRTTSTASSKIPKSPKLSADNKVIMAQFAAQQRAVSGHEILQNIPSLQDSEWLRSSIPKMKEQLQQKEGIREMLLEELAQFYRLKISYLTNATHLPRYKQYFETNKKSKKYRIIVRHELWIGDLLYDDTTFDSDIGTKIDKTMRFVNGTFFQSKLKLSDMARESCLSLTVYLCKLKSTHHHDAGSSVLDGHHHGDSHHGSVHHHHSMSKGVKTGKSHKFGKDDLFEMMVPLAFARFPMIDERNLLRDGKYSLHLWPLPIYVAEVCGLCFCDVFL